MVVRRFDVEVVQRLAKAADLLVLGLGALVLTTLGSSTQRGVDPA